MKVAFVVAIAFVSGITVFNPQKSELELSDVALANVEALADAETSEEFKNNTCCEAVWYESSCAACNGKRYSYAKRI